MANCRNETTTNEIDTHWHLFRTAAFSRRIQLQSPRAQLPQHNRHDSMEGKGNECRIRFNSRYGDEERGAFVQLPGRANDNYKPY